MLVYERRQGRPVLFAFLVVSVWWTQDMDTHSRSAYDPLFQNVSSIPIASFLTKCFLRCPLPHKTRMNFVLDVGEGLDQVDGPAAADSQKERSDPTLIFLEIICRGFQGSGPVARI